MAGSSVAPSSVPLFGPLDAIVGPYIEYVVLALVVANFLTRKLAFDRHKRQAEEADGDADELSRHPLHVASTWVLVLASFYYLTLHHHSGIVLTTLVLGLFLTDFFEFEARRVEVREGHGFERPKGSLVAAVLVFLYAAYLSVFFLVEPLWTQIV